MSAVRRIVLAALMMLAAAASAHAQDVRTTTVQRVARDWLEGVDQGRYEESWKVAGAKFRSALTAQDWSAALKRLRDPLGAPAQRSAFRTDFTRSFPGAPDGDYAIVLFRTSFAKKSEAEETVTLEHEADGTWRVIGYFIR
jgi:hypothetical protein